MPKIEMIAQISGTRDGADWPAAGGTLSVSDDEAGQLIASGLARPAEKASAKDAAPEKAVAAKAETAVRKGGLTKGNTGI